MQSFAVVTSTRPGGLPSEVTRRLTDATELGTMDRDQSFPVESRAAWRNKGGTIAAIAWWSGHDPFGAGRPWHLDEHGFTAFSGHVWPRAKGWNWNEDWAEQLSAYTRARSFPDSADRLSGVFAACSVKETGGHVFSDPFSLGLVYVGRADDIVVFSSSATIAARLVTPSGQEPARSVFGAAWLAYAHVMVPNVTGFEHVDVLEPFARVLIDGHGTAVVVPGRDPADWHIDGLPPAAAMDIIHADLESELRAISGMQGLPMVADLTGGKDGRAILAAMLSSDVEDKFGFFTAGAPDLPDVRIADELREMFSLKSHGRGHTPVDPKRWTIDDGTELLRSMRHFSFATAGMQTQWSRKQLGPPMGKVSVNGIGGEPLYTNYPDSASFRHRENLAQFLRSGQKFGRAGLIRSEYRMDYEGATKRMEEELHDCSASIQDAVDKYYLRVRMRRWFGTGQEVDRMNRIFPLFGAPSIAAAFAMGHRYRQSQYIPYQLMKRADRRLTTVPFAEDLWPGSLRDLIEQDRLAPALFSERRPLKDRAKQFGPPPHVVVDPDAERAALLRGAAATAKTNASTGRRAAQTAQHMKVLREVLVDDPANPLFEIVDHAVTCELVEAYDRLPHQFRQMTFGALTAALWTGRHDLPMFGDS